MALDPEIKPLRRGVGYGLAVTGAALLILSGAALAQGATPKAAPKTAPKAAAQVAQPKSGATTATGAARPAASAVMPDGQLLLVPGRQLKITLADTGPAQTGELRAPADPILAAIPTASPQQWVVVAPDELPTAKDKDSLVFTLYVDPARGTKLVIANGYATPVIFAANLLVTLNGRSGSLPVNTCAVPPGSSSIEFWAGLQVDAVLAPRVATTANPICFDAAADRFYPPGTPPPSLAAAAAAAAPAPAEAPTP